MRTTRYACLVAANDDLVFGVVSLARQIKRRENHSRAPTETRFAREKSTLDPAVQDLVVKSPLQAEVHAVPSFTG